MPLRHRTLSSLGSILFLVVLIAPRGVAQTEPHPLQLASLRPQQELRWHRLSPNSEKPDGPVLYQLLFNASGTPGTIAKFDSNPRHLANSLITDNGSIVAIGSLSIDNTGLITFKSAQSFPLPPAAGDVSGTFPNLTVTRLQGIAVANTAPVSGQVLGFNGTTWAPATLSGGGTVTSVGSGLGLSGGPITTSGMLAIDANVVPQLGAANSFSGLNLFGGGAQLPPAGTATPSQGFNSNAFDLFASAYNTTAGNPVNQKFRWRAEPVNNNTASTSATLNLLFSVGAAAPAETGLSIASNGQVTFASGQNFPASGISLAGDVTGAATATNIAKLQGVTLTATGAANGQVLVFNSGQWAPASVVNNITAGSGLSSSGPTGNVMLTIPNGGVSNAMLQNSTFIVSAGAGLTGGGAGSLGGSAPALAASINHDTSLVGNGGSSNLGLNTSFTNNLYARLAAANIFNTGTQAIQTGAPGTVGLVVQGASAQTANLQEWRNNGGTAVASVSASGAFSGDGSGLTNLSASQLVGGGINPQQVALLKWYAANQTAITFTVGTNPFSVAFDGANIWVVNRNDNSVSKLRASDGVPLGTFTVGANPFGMAFDGANIWVANAVGNSVSKLRASDGAPLGTFTVGTNPFGVAFDGANIWVANFGSNNVSKLRASDGAVLGTFAVGSQPIAVAFDGANIWVTNSNDNTVSKLRASNGAPLGTFTVGTNPFSVAFDGANIWVTNRNDNSVSKLRASDGVPLGTFTVGTNPFGVAFDGANIWVANTASNNVSKLRASDGVPLGTFTVGTNPVGVAFDGANIWVANAGSNNVSKL